MIFDLNIKTERFSIKIAPKHIIFDYSWDKKETNKLFRLVCLFWSEWRDLNPRHPAPKGVRTWCYMCMNYIWRCLVRKTCSPALFSPLFPRPPEAVVVKHVVVWKTLPWNAADLPSPRERCFNALRVCIGRPADS